MHSGHLTHTDTHRAAKLFETRGPPTVKAEGDRRQHLVTPFLFQMTENLLETKDSVSFFDPIKPRAEPGQ